MCQSNFLYWISCISKIFAPQKQKSEIQSLDCVALFLKMNFVDVFIPFKVNIHLAMISNGIQVYADS